MRRSTVVLGSLVVHAALGAALLAAYSMRRSDPAVTAPREPTTIDIEIVEPAPRAPAQTPGGGAPGAPAATSETTPMPAPAQPGPAAPPAATTPPPTTPPPPTPASAPPSTKSSAAAALDADRVAITGFDHAPPGSSRSLGGGGEGASFGGGRGAGFGLGAGGGLGQLSSLPAPPPAPPAIPEPPPSKARPPKLIYPARDREADDSELFVARITVDHDGYVVGARLVRGLGGPRDDQASSAIWRFRYAPALDDTGHAIRATIDQRFLVSR